MHECSQTLAHGNSKIKIRQRNRERRQAEKSENGKDVQRAWKTSFPDSVTNCTLANHILYKVLMVQFNDGVPMICEITIRNYHGAIWRIICVNTSAASH